MLKKILLSVCFIFTLMIGKISYLELSQVTSSLTSLQHLKTKLENAYPSAEFYKNLKQATQKALEGNFTYLNTYGSHKCTEAVKYMIAIVDQIYSRINGYKENEAVLANYIIMMLHILNEIRAKYKPNDKIIIVSVASGRAIQEELLLRTLLHFDYRSILFYAIDPSEDTKNAIKFFKANQILNHYTYHYYPDPKDYLEAVKKGEQTLPNVCFTIGPILVVPTLASEPPNYCLKKNSFFIFPNYMNELSIATSDEKLISRINTLLMNQKNKDLKDLATIKAHIIQSLDTRTDLEKRAFPYDKGYRCFKNLLINFLEITKLANKQGKECIAYYFNDRAAINFDNTSSHLISKSYLDFVNRSNLPLIDFRLMYKLLKEHSLTLWIYNSDHHQFEPEKIEYV